MAQQAQTAKPTQWHQHTSPDDFMPPAKRQRLSPISGSPHPQSPQSSFPNSPGPFPNLALPNAFNNNPRLVTGVQETMAPRASGSMGPPQRPADKQANEKPLDINDLSDLVTSSGIDLKEEENYLAATYRPDRNNISFASSQTLSPQNSFDLLSQNSFGNIGGPNHGSGYLNQAVSQKSAEEELREKHRAAARAASERAQHELNDPFLYGANMRRMIEESCSSNGIKMPVLGLFDRIGHGGASNVVRTTSGDPENTTMQALQAPSILNRDAPLDGIMTLISLAANERLRSLLEDAYGLARGRRLGSDGVVPPDWSDLADAEGSKPTEAIPESATKSSWDQPRDLAALPSPPISDGELQKPEDVPKRPTLEFPKDSQLTAALYSLSRQDRLAEETRLKVRAARRAKKAATAAAATTSTPESSGQDSGLDSGKASNLPPGMLGEKAPEVKMTKKERDRLAKQDLSDEVATRNANTTATMQIGGRSYSWMTKASSKPSPRPSGGAGELGTSTMGGAKSAARPASPTSSLKNTKDRKYGIWREDDVYGRHVQLRDWIAVLETDPKERKTLTEAYLHLDSQEGS